MAHPLLSDVAAACEDPAQTGTCWRMYAVEVQRVVGVLHNLRDAAARSGSPGYDKLSAALQGAYAESIPAFDTLVRVARGLPDSKAVRSRDLAASVLLQAGTCARYAAGCPVERHGGVHGSVVSTALLDALSRFFSAQSLCVPGVPLPSALGVPSPVVALCTVVAEGGADALAAFHMMQDAEGGGAGGATSPRLAALLARSCAVYDTLALDPRVLAVERMASSARLGGGAALLTTPCSRGSGGGGDGQGHALSGGQRRGELGRGCAFSGEWNVHASVPWSAPAGGGNGVGGGGGRQGGWGAYTARMDAWASLPHDVDPTALPVIPSFPSSVPPSVSPATVLALPYTVMGAGGGGDGQGGAHITGIALQPLRVLSSLVLSRFLRVLASCTLPAPAAALPVHTALSNVTALSRDLKRVVQSWGVTKAGAGKGAGTQHSVSVGASTVGEASQTCPAPMRRSALSPLWLVRMLGMAAHVVRATREEGGAGKLGSPSASHALALLLLTRLTLVLAQTVRDARGLPSSSLLIPLSVGLTLTAHVCPGAAREGGAWCTPTLTPPQPLHTGKKRGRQEAKEEEGESRSGGGGGGGADSLHSAVCWAGRRLCPAARAALDRFGSTHVGEEGGAEGEAAPSLALLEDATLAGWSVPSFVSLSHVLTFPWSGTTAGAPAALIDALVANEVSAMTGGVSGEMTGDGEVTHLLLLPAVAEGEAVGDAGAASTERAAVGARVRRARAALAMLQGC